MEIFTNNYAQDIFGKVEFKIIDSGYAKSGSEWKGIVSHLPYSKLYFIISGDPYIVIDKVKISLKKGFAYLLPMGMSYEFACSTSMEQLYFHIRLFNERGYDLLESCENYIEKPVSSQEIDSLKQIYKSQDLLWALCMNEKIYSWIISLLQSSNLQIKNKSYSKCVSKAISYIDKNLSIKLDIKKICEIAYTSESNLTKKFKKETGVSIGKYIDNLVLHKAEQLLLKSDMSIAQISEALGFCDQFYFSRKFKTVFKITPSQYRKMNTKKS
jgi:AraC-like DNA-binding protein